MFRRNSLRRRARSRQARSQGRRPLNPNFEHLEDRRLLTTFVDAFDPTPDGPFCGDSINPCNTIQAGVDNAFAGEEVYVSGGVYTETVTIAKNLHLRGEAGVAEINGVVNGIDVMGMVDVKIEDIEVSDSAIGIRAVGVSSLELDNVDAAANTLDGLTVTGAGSVVIKGGSFDGNGLNGMTIDAVTGDVIITEGGVGAPAAGTTASGNTLTGADITDAGSVSIYRGEFSNNGLDGVALDDIGAGGISIVQSEALLNGSDGFEITDSIETISLDDSLALLNDGSGLNVNNAGAGDVALKNFEATLNGAKGAAIADSASVFDLNGVYSDNDDGGMEMLDIVDTVTLYNTTATDNVTVGIRIAPDLAMTGAGSVAILGGLFADTDGPGSAKSQDTGITALEIAASVNIGPSFGPAGSEIEVSGHAGDGLFLDAGGTADIEGGTFTGNLNGITVLSYDEVEVEGVSASDNVEDGLSVLGSGPTTIEGGTFDGNGLAGIYLDALGFATVTNGAGLTANMNGDDGLYAMGFGELFVEGGSFSHNFDSGLQLYLGANATLSDGVTATGNLTGVYASDVLEGFFDRDGVYSENDVDGILLEDIGGVAVLKNTTATDNDADLNGVGDGLHVRKGVSPFGVGADLVLEGGTYSGQERGIFASDVGGAVFMVPSGPGMELTASSNRDNGALITDSGPVFAVGGDYSDNETEGLRIASVPEVVIDSVTASFNGDDGVELDFFGNAEIFNVTATNNVFDGMNIGGGFDVTIDGGTYDENGDNGISVFLSDNVAISNTSMNLVGVPALFPLSAGIYILDNTSAVLENNTITNSARIGVDIEMTTTVAFITTAGNVPDAVAVDSDTISHVRGVGTVDELALDDIEYSDVTSLLIDTVDSDDSITVQLGATLPAVGVVGGEQRFADTLTAVRESPADAVTVTATSITDGTSTIDYSEIEKVVVDEGDFGFNGTLGLTDIDALVEDIAEGNNTPQYELTGDTKVDHDDLARWLELAGAANLSSGNAYLFGDANLDGIVDGQDFVQWNTHKFTSGALWSGGDFNADGVTDGPDFITWNANKFMDANSGDVVTPSVPLSDFASEMHSNADVVFAAFGQPSATHLASGQLSTEPNRDARDGGDHKRQSLTDLVFAEPHGV